MKFEHKSASISKAIKIISLTILHENILGERGKNLVAYINWILGLLIQVSNFRKFRNFLNRDHYAKFGSNFEAFLCNFEK